MDALSIGPGPARRPRTRRRICGVGLLAWAAIFACDSYSQIRGELDAEARASFDRGRREASACWTCHDLAGDGRKVGPPLPGFYGQRAGSRSDYAYSPALAGAGVVWNAANLNAFLADPQGFLPGNRMLSPGIENRGLRSDLIFFLRLATSHGVEGKGD